MKTNKHSCCAVAVSILASAVIAVAGAGETPHANEMSAKSATDGGRKFCSCKYDEPMEIGNYDVTVSLGTGKGACASYVKFMGRRLAVDRTETKAGETKSVTFTARVPGPYTTRRGDTGSNRRLIVEMFCDAPQADVPAFKPIVVPSPDSRTIYLCGDSTVTDQNSEPWGSWGQILPAFAKKGWAVSNFARSGLALKTFEGEERLKRIFEHLKKDDWVVIQFGHNDQKIKGEEPENGYTRRLNGWIDKIRGKGAFVVLVTPVERRRFNEKTGEHGPKTLEGYAFRSSTSTTRATGCRGRWARRGLRSCRAARRASSTTHTTTSTARTRWLGSWRRASRRFRSSGTRYAVPTARSTRRSPTPIRRSRQAARRTTPSPQDRDRRLAGPSRRSKSLAA